MKIRVQMNIKELRTLKASEKATDTAILDMLQEKEAEGIISNMRNTVAGALASAEKAISTKKDN